MTSDGREGAEAEGEVFWNSANRYIELVNHSKVDSTSFSSDPSRGWRERLLGEWLTISGRVSESGCTHSRLLPITTTPKDISSSGMT